MYRRSIDLGEGRKMDVGRKFNGRDERKDRTFKGIGEGVREGLADSMNGLDEVSEWRKACGEC